MRNRRQRCERGLDNALPLPGMALYLLSHGRLELGVGRGIVPMEAEHFDLPVEELWDIFRETLDILCTAFTTDMLNYEGK